MHADVPVVFFIFLFALLSDVRRYFQYKSTVRQFRNYSAFCEALDIDVDSRETGLYKETRNTSRDLRAVQVFGVEVVDQLSENAESYLVSVCPHLQR